MTILNWHMTLQAQDALARGHHVGALAVLVAVVLVVAIAAAALDGDKR